MKKTCFLSLLIGAILCLSLFFFGCNLLKTTDLSDDHAEISLSVEEPIEPSIPQTEEPPIPSEKEASAPQDKERVPAAAEEPYRYREPESDYAPYLAACVTAGVNVRRGPGTNYSSLFLLSKGDSLPYLWKEGEWYAVWTGERIGYLSSRYSSLQETNLATERVIRAGLRILGTPYEWGAPRILTDQGQINPYFTGGSFDCSSFVQYCYYIGAGIKLGNYTGSQADHTVGKVISRYADLRRGDFYFTGSGAISHVVIYLGNGALLQTYSASGGPVSVTSDEKWKEKFISGRRPNLTVIDQYA